MGTAGCTDIGLLGLCKHTGWANSPQSHNLRWCLRIPPAPCFVSNTQDAGVLLQGMHTGLRKLGCYLHISFACKPESYLGSTCVIEVKVVAIGQVHTAEGHLGQQGTAQHGADFWFYASCAGLRNIMRSNARAIARSSVTSRCVNPQPWPNHAWKPNPELSAVSVRGLKPCRLPFQNQERDKHTPAWCAR